jgi:hypothetical protein
MGYFYIKIILFYETSTTTTTSTGSTCGFKILILLNEDDILCFYYVRENKFKTRKMRIFKVYIIIKFNVVTCFSACVLSRLICNTYHMSLRCKSVYYHKKLKLL